MGLRFRKSIRIAPGLKLNLSKTGVSLTAGTRGFHKTIHTSGRVTTTVGLPGTGISYVDTKHIGRSKAPPVSPQQRTRASAAGGTSTSARLAAAGAAGAQSAPAPVLPGDIPETAGDPPPAQLSEAAVRNIHRDADPSMDWIRYYRETAPPEGEDPELWAYFHGLAPAVLAGDIDAYLDVIGSVNPLDDLLAYGGEFQFGTDDPDFIEVEFVVNGEALAGERLRRNVPDYFDLLRDYVCSVSLRTARDMFALLPVSQVVVHALLENSTVLSVRFDKETMGRIPFGYADPSEAVAQFEHRMDFRPSRGFAPVERIETEDIRE